MKTTCHVVLVLLLLAAAPAAQAQSGSGNGLDYIVNADNPGTITITGPAPGSIPLFLTIPGKISGLVVTGIQADAFYDNPNLSMLNLPGSVTNMGDDAFADCRYLRVVSIASGGAIGDDAFSDCPILISATIADGVISIGTSAF